MATYYKRAGAHNWNNAAGWDTTSSAGAGPAGPPVAGDTAIMDAVSGDCTLTAYAACLNLNQTGYTGTLALGSSNLTIGSGGSISRGGGITSTTGVIAISGNVTIASNGGTYTTVLRFSASGIYTLADQLNAITISMPGPASAIFSGAFNIVCDNFYRDSAPNGSSILTLVSGQALIVSEKIAITNFMQFAHTIKSSTASSPATIVYNGTPENCNINGTDFTDTNFTNPVNQWHGGTLTRCSGITNVIDSNLAVASDAGKIVRGQTVGSVAGTGGNMMINPGLSGGLR